MTRQSPRTNGGPANTTTSASIIPNVTDEPWVIAEREAIRRAVEFRVATWLALGLLVRDRSNDLLLARARAQVDRMLRRRARSA